MKRLLALGCSLILSSGISLAQGRDPGRVPPPVSILKYQLGTRHTDYLHQEEVFQTYLKLAPDRIQRISYGQSTEGRPLRFYAISSPENISRLEDLRKQSYEFARNPQNRPKDLPVFVWINQCIHGDETASFESSMALAHRLLVGDPDLDDTLKNVVVLLNPVYNPDGHERYVTAYNSIPNGNPEAGSYDRAIPPAFMGRRNHYRFDLNRDRVAMSQVETRREVNTFLRWMPQVYLDQHGQVETYFFPPVQQSVNTNVDRARYETWTTVFGKATARAFDAKGWTYYIRDQYDLFNACYLDSHTSLMGAIGMTNETDGGRVLLQRREDDTLLSLEDGLNKHLISALAVITAAGEHKDQLLDSYQQYKLSAVTGKHAGKLQHVVITSRDRQALWNLRLQLERTGIASKIVEKGWTQKNALNAWTGVRETVQVPARSLVVDMAQPLGQLAKALLEPDSPFEPEFVQRNLTKAKNDEAGEWDPELDSFEFYDATAWSLPFAHGLKAWWCEKMPTVPVVTNFVGGGESYPADTGYVLRYKGTVDIRFVARLLQEGVHVSQVNREMVVGGKRYEPGTFLILKARNHPSLRITLSGLDFGYQGIELEILDTSYPDEGRQGPGSESITQLVKPRIGVVFGDAGELSGGEIWYLMEQEFKMAYSSLTVRGALQNLKSYNCLVIPDGVNWPMSAPVKEWVAAGGVLVYLHAESEVFGEEGYQKLKPVSGSSDLPGSFFRAKLNPSSYLSYGYERNGNNPIELAVPVEGSSFFAASPLGSVVEFADAKTKKLLSGWAWPTTEGDLADTVWLQDIRRGRGHVIAFTQDPTWRAQLPGLFKLVLNAMVLAPSH